jgi:uncharacterized membrane protein
VRENLDKAIARWLKAGVIDAATAARLRAHETAARAPETGRLAVFAFGFGGLLLAAGVLLFVASHWIDLGPGARFASVVAMVMLLHVAAGAAAPRQPALTVSLHAAGTAALGAGIFLAGQVFHLAAHWPSAFLLWAVGAAVALALLRDWPHALWVAVLVPLWLWAEWLQRAELAEVAYAEMAAIAVGFTVLATAYVSACARGLDVPWRRALARLGAIILLPSAYALAGAGEMAAEAGHLPGPGVAPGLVWSVALLLPLATAVALRRRDAWPVAVAVWLAYFVTLLDTTQASHKLLSYLAYAAGSIGLILWGLRDGERLRVNLGVLGFALTVLWFYFGSLFDMLGRALGLIGMGILFIGGGWWLERARRSLVGRIGGVAP